jgi:hypothetical protein
MHFLLALGLIKPQPISPSRFLRFNAVRLLRGCSETCGTYVSRGDEGSPSWQMSGVPGRGANFRSNSPAKMNHRLTMLRKHGWLEQNN